MVIEKFELSSINGGYRISALLGPCHQLFFHLLLFFFSFFCSIYYFIILHISHNLSFAPVWRKRFLCAIRASKYILTNRESLFLFFFIILFVSPHPSPPPPSLPLFPRSALHTDTIITMSNSRARARAKPHATSYLFRLYKKYTLVRRSRAFIFIIFFI